MPQSFAAMYCHIIYSTKHREPMITADIQPRLFEYFGGILRNKSSRLIAAGGMPDHVHLLVSLGKELSVSAAVRFLKANSSKWIHETFPTHPAFAWQTGYGAFSVSQSSLDHVRRYIAGQAEHHRKRTFQDELRTFLKRHEIENDDRYVWD